FMSCSAKMPVYSMFIMAFFPNKRGLVVASLYMLGAIVAILSAFILQKTVLKGGHAPFVMELPPYRLPTGKTLGLHLYDKIKDFMTKAGTVLLGASVVIWFCQYFTFSLTHAENSADSILGAIGTFIAPVFTPLGFGDWQSSVSMVTGLIARESIVSTMGILFGTGEASISSVIAGVYSPASAYSFMTFALLSIPCIAAVTTMRKEMNSRKWTLIALSFQAVMAYIITFIVYNVCRVVM
ncbi:MAG: nucleoside recognition domain-containing protein, partial [Oscillospiraceae bacterium]